MPTTLLRRITLLALAPLFVGACIDRAEPLKEPARQPAQEPAPYARALPRIGARVRVIVPSLGPGWRVGMFSQTRQIPPCYVVLLFNPRGKAREIVSTVHLAAAVRLQVSSLYDGIAGHDPDPGAAGYDGENWLDARLDTAIRSGRDCQ